MISLRVSFFVLNIILSQKVPTCNKSNFETTDTKILSVTGVSVITDHMSSHSMKIMLSIFASPGRLLQHKLRHGLRAVRVQPGGLLQQHLRRVQRTVLLQAWYRRVRL